MRMHIQNIPKAPHECDSKIPKWLSDITLKLLEKKPEDRYSNARDIIREIQKHVPELVP